MVCFFVVLIKVNQVRVGDSFWVDFELMIDEEEGEERKEEDMKIGAWSSHVGFHFLCLYCISSPHLQPFAQKKEKRKRGYFKYTTIK